MTREEMPFILKRTAWSLVFACLLGEVSAQFMYIGADLGYRTATLRKRSGGYGDASKLNQFQLGFAALWRPVREVGLGISVRYAGIQGGKRSFEGTSPVDGSTFRGFNSSLTEPAYRPFLFNYDIDQGLTVEIPLRLFVPGNANFYVEGKVAFSRFEESFRFTRFSALTVYDEYGGIRSGPLDPAFIDEAIERTVVYPGFALGMMPHLERGFYLNLSFGLDLIAFNDTPSFSYDIEHDWDFIDDHHDVMRFSSALTGVKKVWNAQVGIGTFF